MLHTMTDRRLRRLAGKRLEASEEIVEWCRVWSSRPTRLAILAARFRDFAVLTDRRLLMFEAGWITRVARRRVLADRLDEIAATPIRGERAIRLEHPIHKPQVLQFGRDAASQTIVRELVERTANRRNRTIDDLEASPSPGPSTEPVTQP